MLLYPRNVVWYLESRPWSGTTEKPGFAPADPASMGSAVVVQLEKLDDEGRPQQPPFIRKYLLTCAHVVRGKPNVGANGWGPLFQEVLCWPPGKGYVRTAQDGRKSGKIDGPLQASVLAWSPSGNEKGDVREDLRTDANDWVLLDVGGADFQAAPAVAGWASIQSGEKLKIVGFPGGAGFQAAPQWNTGDLVESVEPALFSQTRTPEAGMLRLDGPDETRPGMSGGGIFLSNGLFVGIHRSSIDQAMERGAIAADHIRSWLVARGWRPVGERLPEGKKSAAFPDSAIREDLIAALSSVFQPDELPSLLKSHLGLPLDGVISPAALAMGYDGLVNWDQQPEGWVRALVRILVEERPQHHRVDEFAKKYPQYAALLTQEEREHLCQCLATVVTKYSQLHALVAQAAAIDLDQYVPESSVPAADAPAEPFLKFIIRRTDHFGGIDRFIEAALLQFPGPVVEGKAKPFMEIIQARRRQWQHPEDDPFQAADLGGKLLINRTRLRDSLEDLTKTGKTRIVAVKGPKRSGKSHSIYYLEHIERVFGKYQMAIVRLEEDEEPATFDPPLLIEAVLNQLGLDVSRIPTQTVGVTETRWVRRLMDFLVGQIKTTGKTVLVVLDGFSHPNLPSLTRDLVRELVKRAATDSKLRIALLDYSDDLLPIEAAGRFSTESIPNFTRADLCNFFLKFARANGKNPPAATIDIMVDHILKAVPAGDSDRIENVAKEVEKWTLGLKGDA